jgi:hypothetical protein
MALFKFLKPEPFRVRSPQRDLEADTERLARLHVFLEDFRADIMREYDGLRARHDSVTERAAFSQQALEDDQLDAAMSVQVDDLTEAMIRYGARLKALEQQIAFVTGMLGEAERFPLEK